MKDTIDLVSKCIEDYAIIRLLGRGGFSDVYLAENRISRERVAVKIVGQHPLIKQIGGGSTIVLCRKARAIDSSITGGPRTMRSDGNSGHQTFHAASNPA